MNERIQLLISLIGRSSGGPLVSQITLRWITPDFGPAVDSQVDLVPFRADPRIRPGRNRRRSPSQTSWARL